MLTSIKDFEVLRKLGDGSFSQVYQVLRKSDSQLYAMKKVKMNSLKSKERENAVNEVRILASIDNNSIVHYKEAFFDENSNSLCIIMEYMAGGTLADKISSCRRTNQRIDEETIWSYLHQALKALQALHSLSILHRDLKSANIFLSKDQKTLKIGDLNVSKVAKAGLLYTQTGTPYYASPEIWRDEAYNYKSDIWSIGCVLYELCALRPPFISNDMQDLYNKVQKGGVSRIWGGYSEELWGVVEKCLSKSASKRPDCDTLLRTITLFRKNSVKNEESSIFSSDTNKLLKTIKVPRNLRCLVNVLPKANYDKSGRELSFPKISSKKEDKENLKPVLCQAQSVKHIKMPRLDVRSKSPSIFK